MEAGIRRPLTRCMLRFFYGYSIVLGITTIRFDFARQRVIKSRALAVYASCVNAFFIALMPVALYMAFGFTDNLSSNILLRIMNKASVMTYIFVSFAVMVYRRKREKRSEFLARHLFKLDLKYFNKLPRIETIERRFELLILAEAFTTFGKMAATLFGMLELAHVYDLKLLLRVGYAFNSKYMLHGVVFQTYIEMSHVCKRFEILNVQLNRLLHTLRAIHTHGGQVLHMNSVMLQQLYRLATTDLQQISQVHWQLACLVDSLCNMCILQTMGMLLTYSIATIVFGYISFLVADGSLNLPTTTFSKIFSFFAYINFLSDLYLFYLNCDATMAAYRRAVDILKQFNELPTMNNELESCSEKFSCQLLQRKMQFTVSGMHLNLQTLLALWAFIIRHTIIVVQSDLEYRARQLK